MSCCHSEILGKASTRTEQTSEQLYMHTDADTHTHISIAIAISEHVCNKHERTLYTTIRYEKEH